MKRSTLHAAYLTSVAVLVFPTSPATARHLSVAGTVQTVAGPSFCRETASLELGSESVGSIAVDSQGRIFFDTGVASTGLVAKVDSNGEASHLKALPRGIRGGRGSSRPSIRGPASNRLISDGEGGVFLAAGSRVVWVNSANSLTTIAGEAAGKPFDVGSESSGDGSIAQQARFISARSLARGPDGSLFVSDLIDPSVGSFRIRFINKSTQPVAFYSGTPEETIVAPGDIDTIAGVPVRASSKEASRAKRGTFIDPSPAMALAWPVLYVTSKSDAAAATRTTRKVGWTIQAINLSGAAVFRHGMNIDPGQFKQVGRLSLARSAPAREQLRPFTFLKRPGIDADGSGVLYVADRAAHRIVKINESGRTSMVAGTGRPGFNGNDGKARNASLNGPIDLKVGSDGRIYLSDAGNHQIRVIDRAGYIRAAPGNGIAVSYACRTAGSKGSKRHNPGSGVSSDRQTSSDTSPSGIAIGSRGAVYFSLPDAHQIKKVDSRGAITTVAGRAGGDRRCPGQVGCPGFSGDGGPALRASLRDPASVFINSADGLYFWDSGNARIRFINLSSRAARVHGVKVGPGQIQTVAGNGTPGPAQDPGRALASNLGSVEVLNSYEVKYLEHLDLQRKLAGPAEAALVGPLLAPGSVAADQKGNLFIADTANRRVRRVDRSGTIATIAGEGATGRLRDCCKDPVAVEVDPAGNVLVADRAASLDYPNPSLFSPPPPAPKIWLLNLSARRLSSRGVLVEPRSASALAGNGGFGLRGDGGPALESELLIPLDLDTDKEGNLYIAEVGGLAGGAGQVRIVDGSGTIWTIAGTGQEGFNGDGLKATVTRLRYPAGVTVDRKGNLFIADVGNDRVRKVSHGGTS